MAYPQKWLYETSAKMSLVLALLFIVCRASAYDSSSSEELPDDIVDTKRFSSEEERHLKRFSNLDEDEMAKRALSLLAHWRPQFLGLPKVNTRSDVISAVTRGGRPSRPLGQPLRWG